MKIKLYSLFVEDQSKALTFYTEILGFELKHDIPMGEYRWITLIDSEDTSLELALEPNVHPAAKAYQKALFADGIPATAFESEDIENEYTVLKNRGVTFTHEITNVGSAKIAIFSDTCGNLIQIYETI